MLFLSLSLILIALTCYLSLTHYPSLTYHVSLTRCLSLSYSFSDSLSLSHVLCLSHSMCLLSLSYSLSLSLESRSLSPPLSQCVSVLSHMHTILCLAVSFTHHPSHLQSLYLSSLDLSRRLDLPPSKRSLCLSLCALVPSHSFFLSPSLSYLSHLLSLSSILVLSHSFALTLTHLSLCLSLLSLSFSIVLTL